MSNPLYIFYTKKSNFPIEEFIELPDTKTTKEVRDSMINSGQYDSIRVCGKNVKDKYLEYVTNCIRGIIEQINSNLKSKY